MGYHDDESPVFQLGLIENTVRTTAAHVLPGSTGSQCETLRMGAGVRERTLAVWSKLRHRNSEMLVTFITLLQIHS